MSRKRILLPLILSAFAISCLKAKRSPFDVSSKSPASNLIIGRALTATNTVTSASSTSPPSNLTYSITALQSKLIPGNTTVITPTFLGTVSSWTISPTTLPPGVTFDTKTGVITCSPPIGSPAFPLTNFIVTAINPGGNTSFTVPLQVLGSGENVWTVINGVSGDNTVAGNNSMKFDPVTNSIYIAGYTKINLDGEPKPSAIGVFSGYLSKYDLDGNRKWTKIFGSNGSGGTTVSGLALDSNGNIYIGGNSFPGTFDGLTFSAASGAGFIIKFDSSGNRLWTSSGSTSVNHTTGGIILDNAGNVVTAGAVYAPSINSVTNNSWSDQGLLLQKFNSNTGAYISTTLISAGTNRGIDGLAIDKDSSGNIFVAAGTRNASYCGDGSVNWRPALFRFNSSMGYIACTGGLTTGSASSFPFGITTSSTGESYISGYVSNSLMYDSLPAQGLMDGFVTKFDINGTKLWSIRVGISGAMTIVNAIALQTASNPNKLYLAGRTSGNLGGTIQGTQDMFTAVYDPTNGTQPNTQTYWTRLQGAIGGADTGWCVLSSPATCANSIVFDSNSTLYSFGDTTGTISGITNPATPNRSLFLVRNVQ